MTATVALDLRETCITKLMALEPDLRQAGIVRMSLFGSVARGEATARSDVDLLVKFDPDARMDLIRMIELEEYLGNQLGRVVQFTTEPIRNPYLRTSIEEDLKVVF